MNKNIEILLAVLGSIIWGLTFIFIKPLVNLASASDITFWRYFISGNILLIFWFIKMRKFNLKFKDLKMLIFTAAIGIFIYQMLCNVGVSMIKGSHAGIINGLVPVITVVMERIFKKYKITPIKKISLILSMAGILLVASNGGSTEVAKFNWGYLLTLAGITLWVVYTFMTESLLEKYSGVELIGYQSVIGALMAIPYNIIFEHRIISFNIFSTLEGTVNILLVSILVAGIGYGLYIRGVKALGLGTMAFMLNIIPISALIAGYFILGEAITMNSVYGVALILFSVYLVLSDSKPKKKKKQLKKLNTAS